MPHFQAPSRRSASRWRQAAATCSEDAENPGPSLGTIDVAAVVWPWARWGVAVRLVKGPGEDLHEPVVSGDRTFLGQADLQVLDDHRSSPDRLDGSTRHRVGLRTAVRRSIRDCAANSRSGGTRHEPRHILPGGRRARGVHHPGDRASRGDQRRADVRFQFRHDESAADRTRRDQVLIGNEQPDARSRRRATQSPPVFHDGARLAVMTPLRRRRRSVGRSGTMWARCLRPPVT